MIRTPKKFTDKNQQTPAAGNTAVCKICLKPEGSKNKENGIICSYCEEFYHINCVNLDQNLFNKLVSKKNLIWSCPNCVSNSVNSDVKYFADFKSEIKDILKNSMQTMNETISSLREDIVAFKKDTNTQFEEFKMDVQEKINVMNQDLDEIKTNVNAVAGIDIQQIVPIIKESLKLDKIIDSSNNHQNKIKNLEAELTSVELDVDNMNRLSRLNNLILDGIPVYKNENNKFFYQVVEGIANYLGVEMSYYDINTAFRLPKNKDSHIPSIIIGFHSKLIRDNVYNQYLKKRVMKLSDVNSNGSSNRLYLNEHLTPKYSKLIRNAKDMKLTGAIVKVYSRNGIPMVVPDGQSTAVKIFSNEDLDKIKVKFEMHRGEIRTDESTK